MEISTITKNDKDREKIYSEEVRKIIKGINYPLIGNIEVCEDIRF
jgi:hypothetical protein